MLNKLFENPSEKFQGLLKWWFIISSTLGAVSLVVYEISLMVLALKMNRPADFALQFVLMIVFPVVFIACNYFAHLFWYMLLGFFSDIHDIRDGLEYGVLKAFPQDKDNDE